MGYSRLAAGAIVAVFIAVTFAFAFWIRTSWRWKYWSQGCATWKATALILSSESRVHTHCSAIFCGIVLHLHHNHHCHMRESRGGRRSMCESQSCSHHPHCWFIAIKIAQPDFMGKPRFRRLFFRGVMSLLAYSNFKCFPITHTQKKSKLKSACF